MALVFLAGLFDFRRPGRIAHLDLLVLLSFGISQVFFNGGEIGVSVPLVYPPLVYLLARMLWIGFRGGGGLRPSLPVRWLGLAAILLIAFRITINIADSGVIDVGYAGTIGADRITHGEPLWGEGVFPDDNRFGDTYGPANYYAYVPFELALPWSGEWDELPASHAAAIAFDLATVAGLFFCATRLVGGRAGRDLGVLSRSPGSPTRTRRSRCSRTPTTRWSRRCSSGRWLCSPVRSPAGRCSPRRRWPSSRRWRWCRCTRPATAACSGGDGERPRGWRRCARWSVLARPSSSRRRCCWSIRRSTGPRDVLRPHRRSASSTAPRRSASGARSTGSSGCRRRSSRRPPCSPIAARLRPAAPRPCPRSPRSPPRC